MKKTILITIAAFLLSLTLKAKEPTPGKKLTVTFILKNGNQSKIFAKSKRYLYMATCNSISENIKVGTIINALPFKGQKDAVFIFNRVK